MVTRELVNTDWVFAVNSHPEEEGIWLPAAQRRPLRLVLEIMAGPSPMGQFSHREARRVALGLSLSP